MSVSIPLSWMKCASCGKPLNGMVKEQNKIVCANCKAVNKIILFGGIGENGKHK